MAYEFSSKVAAKQYFKQLLGGYNHGDRVSGDDALQLYALIERHPERDRKVGCGIDHFEVRQSEYGNNGFWLVRSDGTSTDFSYLSCIQGEPPSHRLQVNRAFRAIVRFDIQNAVNVFFDQMRDENGMVACAESGELIAREAAHLDHRPPLTFEVIVETFLAYHGLLHEQIDITAGSDGSIHPELLDKEMANDFRRYHANTARLDVIKSDLNLKNSTKFRIREGRVRILSGFNPPNH